MNVSGTHTKSTFNKADLIIFVGATKKNSRLLRCCDAARLECPVGTRHRGVVFRRVGRHRVLRQSGDVVLDRKRVCFFFLGV